MPDLILSLPHYHRHITICVVQIIDTPHNFRPCVSFAEFAFYIAVRCGFDKLLHLTSGLNAHNHNTYIRLPQTGCTAPKMALFIITQDRQTKIQAGSIIKTKSRSSMLPDSR